MAARFMTTVIVAIALAQCALIGSNPEELDLSKRHPVYLGERTFSGFVGMSQRGGQQQTHAPQQMTGIMAQTPPGGGHDPGRFFLTSIPRLPPLNRRAFLLIATLPG